MTRRFRVGSLIVPVVALVTLVGPAFAENPVGISPGAVDRIAGVEGRCPTFIWNSVPGAEYHELVGYRLPDDAAVDPATLDLADAGPRLYARVSGAAPAWQPELAKCLAPGGTYVWFVRAVFREVDGEVVEASEWSYGRYFSISNVPSVREVEEALGVLRRHARDSEIEAEPEGPPRAAARRHGVAEFSGREPAEGTSGRSKSVMTSKTAIKGTMTSPSISNETYGVVGVNNSDDGAALGAAHTDGGADLILDGDLDKEADAIFTQAGVDRPAGSRQTFSFDNSLGGGFTLRVDGSDVVTTDTDSDTLAGLSCASGEIAEWNGSSWVCADDDDTPPREAGNQLSLAGNDLGVVEGPGSGLDADTVDGQHAAAFSTAGHGHFGGTWTGSDSIGLKVDNDGGSGIIGWSSPIYGVGVVGMADAVSTETTGVYGQSDSDQGRGVHGYASAASGETYGVYGESDSTGGRGVYGYAGATESVTYGVYGESSAYAGRGVYGLATSTSGLGQAYGVYGKSESPAGRGVYGWASRTSGSTIGVWGRSNSIAGRGVFGMADADSGTTYGVWGRSESSDGRGVFGEAAESTGTTFGVYGVSLSADGYGGYFVNIASGGTLIAANDAHSTDDLEFKVDSDGNVYADGAYHCANTSPGTEPGTCIIQGTEADFAEMLPAERDLEPGDVLGIDAEGRLVRSSLPYQGNVVGVYSTRPGYLGGGDSFGRDGHAPLALVGIVPVKASLENGSIRPGDMLVASSSPGHAMRGGEGAPQGSVIGKALDALEDGRATIRMIVMLQ
jgi:hypothetical protein